MTDRQESLKREGRVWYTHDREYRILPRAGIGGRRFPYYVLQHEPSREDLGTWQRLADAKLEAPTLITTDRASRLNKEQS